MSDQTPYTVRSTVPTLGLLISVVVVAANTSDNWGGIDAVGHASFKTSRLTKIWCDAGFKATFGRFCDCLRIDAEVVSLTATGGFEVLPRRWVVERTSAWLVNHRRLRTDYDATRSSPPGSSGPHTPASSYAASPPHNREPRRQ